MPHCNDADSGYYRDPKGCRLPAGDGSRERLRKTLPQSARTDTGLASRQVTALRTGNLHVRFLGGLGTATSPGYPTRAERTVNEDSGKPARRLFWSL
jgi:hypothetical protein